MEAGGKGLGGPRSLANCSAPRDSVLPENIFSWKLIIH